MNAEHAAELVQQADTILADFIKPGSWPRATTAERFEQSGALERVLSLYSAAIRLDPAEAAYPWNLAGSLHRLGCNELALTFIERAIRTARDAGDAEWAGAGAHLAWAEMAVSAGHFDAALVALARANALAGDSAPLRAGVRRLRGEIERGTRRDHPELELAEKLEALSA